MYFISKKFLRCHSSHSTAKVRLLALEVVGVTCAQVCGSTSCEDFADVDTSSCNCTITRPRDNAGYAAAAAIISQPQTGGKSGKSGKGSEFGQRYTANYQAKALVTCAGGFAGGGVS